MQGGQYVLDVVDFFSGGFVIFALVVVELIGVCWIYGTDWWRDFGVYLLIHSYRAQPTAGRYSFHAGHSARYLLEVYMGLPHARLSPSHFYLLTLHVPHIPRR